MIRRPDVAPVVLLAGVLVLFQLVAHLDWPPAGGLELVSPRVTSGDETHYLLVANSLLRDGDVEMQEDYWRVALGSREAGERWNGVLLDHHTVIVDRAAGESWGWHAVYSLRRSAPCFPGTCMGFEPLLGMVPPPRHATVEVPAHPVAFPALVAAVLAPFRPSPAQTEGLAVRVAAFFSWLAIVAMYLAARRAGVPARWGAAAVVLVAVGSSFLPYARSFFAETTIALALAAGLWAMQADRPALAGVAVAFATFMKPPFVLVGVAWAAERLWARRPRSAIVLAAVVGAASVGLMAFNWWLARVPLIGGAEPLRLADGPSSAWRALFDAKSGVLLFVPWVIIPLVAPMVLGARLDAPADGEAKLLRQIALATALYLVVLAALGNGPGYCYGPRFWIPVLPLLGLAAAVLARKHRLLWVPLALLAVIGALVAVPAAVRYRHVFYTTPTQAWDLPPARSP